jgi:hypothetical protein
MEEITATIIKPAISFVPTLILFSILNLLL